VQLEFHRRRVGVRFDDMLDGLQLLLPGLLPATMHADDAGNNGMF